MHIYGHRIQQTGHQPVSLSILHVSAKQIICFFSRRPRLCLRIWSRETGSAVPPHVSLLIPHTQAESGAYSRNSSRFPRRRPFIFTAVRHRVSPEFIGSRNCVPMAFTAVPVTGAAFAGHHGPINVRLSFSTPTIGMMYEVGMLKVSADISLRRFLILRWDHHGSVLNMPTLLPTSTSIQRHKTSPKPILQGVAYSTQTGASCGGNSREEQRRTTINININRVPGTTKTGLVVLKN